MSLIERVRARLVSERSQASVTARLAEAEQLLRSGGAVTQIRRLTTEYVAEDQVESAWRALFLGDPGSAIDAAYAAAEERPYDVDSRIVHGTARLARNDLDHAEHEFDAVIEEFGAEPDAADGRRATILARGFAPLDELPASEQEWKSAAVLLTTLWRLAGVADVRLANLADAHPDGLSVIMHALEHGQAADSEAEDGTV